MRHSVMLTTVLGVFWLVVACGDDRASSDGGETETEGGSPTGGSSTASTTLTTAGTTSGTDPGSSDSSSSESSGESGDPEPPPPPTSPKANVRFKGPRRLANDLGQALGLAPDAVCTELDGLSCTEDVHTVTLGGVEPWSLGIYSPAEHSAVTSPIAVDRVVLHACAKRVDLDFTGSAELFDLELSGTALSDVDDASVAASIDRLYTRGLLRHAEPAEVASLRQLYASVAATGTEAPARDWAVATCFATLTTMEFLFY